MTSGGSTLTAVVPVKRLAEAKRRMDVAPDVRAEIAGAFARDVILTVNETVGIDHAVVVTPDPGIRRFARLHGLQAVREAYLPSPDPLNAAICRALRAVPDRQSRVVVVPSDLPALAPHGLADLVEAARRHDRALVRDLEGTGTTLLFAAHTDLLRPRYGPGSALLHRELGHAELTAGPGARRDVDDLDTLADALDLGVGDWTYQVVRRHGLLARGTATLGSGPRPR